MTQPTPPPTQTQHPWRATARTIAAATVAALPILPVVVDQLGATGLPWVAGVVAAAGALTRVLAIPAVDDWLRDYAPWLSAQPPSR